MPVGRTPKPATEPYPTPEESQSPPSSSPDALTPDTPTTFSKKHASVSAGPANGPPSYGEAILDFSQSPFGPTDFEPSFSPMEASWFGPATLYPTSPGAQSTAAPDHALAVQTPLPAVDHRPPCTCFDVLSRTLRDLQQSPVESKPLEHVLRLNRALLKVIHSIIAATTCAHDGAAASLDVAVYFCLNKLVATYHEALYMPHCDSSVIRFGSYTVETEDRAALKRQIILLDIRKIIATLEVLAARDQRREDEGAVERGGESWARREQRLLHSFTKNEAERVSKHIYKLSGG